MRRSLVGTALFLFACCAAWTQPAARPLSFEVASLKPSAPNEDGFIRRRLGGGPGSTDPGQLTWNNVTLKMIVTAAYNLKDYQVEGPEWIDSLGYDLVAKLAPNTTKDQMAEMLQTLLAERFKMELHRETRQLPIYALVVGKGGPKMKEVQLPAVPDGSPAGPGEGRGGPLPGPGGVPPAGGRGPAGGGGGPATPGIRMMMTPEGLHLAGAMNMTQLTNMLTRQMGRAVLDQTELNGTYDVDISWMPEDLGGGGKMMGGMPPPSAGGNGGEAPLHNSAKDPTMTLPQALQEKLGLRLDPRKSSAEILIIDKAERVPVEN